MWIYVFNDSVIVQPDIHTTYSKLPPLPDDLPDETVLSVLEKTFPGKDGEELVRLEDHIRHAPVTRLCECGEAETPEILRKLQDLPKNIRIGHGRICRKKSRFQNPDLLPPLYGGQWQICAGCAYFTQKEKTGRCGKRRVCKWAASKPREWEVDKSPVPYHSQCAKIAQQFRFETAFLCWTKRFEAEAAARDDAEKLFAERERILRHDIAAAAENGDAHRLLGETPDGQ